MRAWSCVGPALLAAGCATAPPPAPPAPPPPPPEREPEPAPPPPSEPEKPAEMPSACSQPSAGELCTPDREFVHRLCGGSYPEVALALLAKGSPWTRGYLARPLDAWNASGGLRSSAKLSADEEVLILERRGGEKGGIVVGGASGAYEALRWDGTCVSLDAGEVRLRRPARPKHADIRWKHLDERTREALLADSRVREAFDRRRKACGGGAAGDTASTCEKADASLSAAIVSFLRGGGRVPVPSQIP